MPRGGLAPRGVSSPQSRRVRINFISNLSEGIPALFCALIIRFIEIATLLAVLIATKDSSCDQPLYLFLAVTAAQQVLACVLHCFKNQNVAPEHQPAWIQNLEATIGMTMFSWFLCGNVWTFTSTECDATLHAASVALIAFIYLCLALPLIVILLVIFCLPVMALLLPLVVRFFPHVDGQKAATDEQISRLEERCYTAGDYAPEDASCCICLEDYAEQCELRVLPCGHHFHKGCVDQWLHTSAVCPLCKEHPFLPAQGADEGVGAENV